MRLLIRPFSSFIAMSSFEVRHDVKGREFYIALEKGFVFIIIVLRSWIDAESFVFPFFFVGALQWIKIHKMSTGKKMTLNLVSRQKPSLDRGNECIEYTDNKKHAVHLIIIYLFNRESCVTVRKWRAQNVKYVPHRSTITISRTGYRSSPG